MLIVSYNDVKKHKEVIFMSPFTPSPHPPVNPPPNAPPMYPTGSTIEACLYTNAYVWPKDGEPYWFNIQKIESDTMSGFRWISNSWFYEVIDLSTVDGVVCTKII